MSDKGPNLTPEQKQKLQEALCEILAFKEDGEEWVPTFVLLVASDAGIHELHNCDSFPERLAMIIPMFAEGLRTGLIKVAMLENFLKEQLSTAKPN